MAKKTPGENYQHVITGTFLSDGRKGLGMTQGRLAEDLGCTRQFVTSIEAGTAKLPWRMAKDWVEVLGLNLTSLYRCIELDMKKSFKLVTGCKVK